MWRWRTRDKPDYFLAHPTLTETSKINCKKLTAISGPLGLQKCIKFCVWSLFEWDFRKSKTKIWWLKWLKNYDVSTLYSIISVQKFNFSETFNLCTKRFLNLTKKLTNIFSPKFKVWLILVRILWKVLLPKSKNRNKMSHRFQKLLKKHVSTFLKILYRTVAFLNLFIEEIFKI